MRPEFKDIQSYEEFCKYYWYREELQQICKEIGADYALTKLELEENIKCYLQGSPVKKAVRQKRVATVKEALCLDTPLLACGFAFNQKFRKFFADQIGVKKFKFHVDMVATVKKVRQEGDTTFTLGDLLDVYYGQKKGARYDLSSCQWNQFLKDFCADEDNAVFHDKLKVAAVLWGIVRSSTDKKVYTKQLVQENLASLQDYL